MNMSFNPITTQTQQVQSQPLAIREGQVFHGTINKLYPDQMAEVQVGQNKFVAKLETPLKAGDAHFFQVTSTSAQTELKVVTGPMTQSMSPQQQMQQLLQNMNMSPSKELQQVMGHFIKEQIPISREQLLAAESWMKALPDGISKQDALTAMQRMVELKMPFTNQVFQALVQGAKTDGMHTAIQNFIGQLQNATTGNEQIKSNLLNQLQTLAKPLDAETGGVLLAKAVQTLMDTVANATSRMQALATLKEAGILPQNATLSNWQGQTTQQALPLSQQPTQAGQLIQQVLQAAPADSAKMIQNVKAFIQQDSLLTMDQKAQLTQLIQRFSQLPQTKQTMEIFAKQLNEQLVKAYANNQDSRLFTQNEQGLTNKEQLLSLLKPNANSEAALRNLVKVSNDSPLPQMQSLVVQAEAQVNHAIDSKAMEQAMRTVLKGLGVSYESALNSKAGDMQELAQSLKPQLQALLQDAQIPTALRDTAEVLMARLNGMQLLSNENGHQHQLVMQVPLEFFGKKMDATLQWNGRMGKDGKMDANFARVLFYLNMDSLAETVIDMQVQNRIVTVTVFNDEPNLQLLAEPLKRSLKAGLAEKDYHLSAVFVKQFEQQLTEKIVTQNSKSDAIQHTGVDFRV